MKTCTVSVKHTSEIDLRPKREHRRLDLMRESLNSLFMGVIVGHARFYWQKSMKPCNLAAVLGGNLNAVNLSPNVRTILATPSLRPA